MGGTEVNAADIGWLRSLTFNGLASIWSFRVLRGFGLANQHLTDRNVVFATVFLARGPSPTLYQMDLKYEQRCLRRYTRSPRRSFLRDVRPALVIHII